MRLDAFTLACFASVCQNRRVQTRDSSDALVELSHAARKNIEVLKSDFANIFRRDPQWNTFSKYFSIGDRTTGRAVYGLDNARKVTELLRRINKRFSVKDFKVDFTESSLVLSEWLNNRFQREVQESLDDEIISHFSVELARKTSGGLETPIVVEGQMVFRLNRDSKVSLASLTTCFVNGFQAIPMVWPEVNLEDANSLDGIDEWIQAFSETTQSVAAEQSENLLAGSIYGIGEYLASDFSSLSNAVAALKTDFVKVFRQEPHWNIFDQNLTLSDQTGVNLTGLESNQMLSGLLRKLHRKFTISNVHVLYQEEVESRSSWRDGKIVGKVQKPLKPTIQAGWKLSINHKRHSLQPWKRDPPLTLQAQTFFHINAASKFDAIVLNDIYINDEFDVMEWPDVDLTEPADLSMEYIEHWLLDIQYAIAHPEEFAENSDSVV